MHQTKKRNAGPMLFGLSTIAALILALSMLAAGSASAQTPYASPTATTAAASPTATTTTSTAASPTTTTSTSGQTAASPSAVAPNTGSGVAASSSPSTMPFVLGGFAVAAGSLALLGASLRKRS